MKLFEQKHPDLNRVAPFAWALALFIQSSIPGDNLEFIPKLFPDMDKMIHAAIYAVFGWLIVAAFPKNWVRRVPWRTLALCVLIGSLYGASDEWHQSFVTGRSSSIIDWVYDTFGTAVGCGLWLKIFRKRFSSEKVSIE